MILGSNANNFINYIYHFLMGRILGPSEYGILASLISLIGLVSVIPLSLNLVIVKFISSARDKTEVSHLFFYLQRKIVALSIFVFLLMFFLAPKIAGFLNIKESLLVVLVGLTFLFSLPSLIYRATLQGLLLFKDMIFSIMVENFLKLIIGVGLVYLGFSVGGAILAIVIATFFGWLVARSLTQKAIIATFEVKKTDFAPKYKTEVLIYAIPVLLQSVSMTSLLSTDLILVKHFFPPSEAGLYAALSSLGKIIFYGVGPISAVMFPMISQRSAKGHQYTNIFVYSLALTALLSAVALMVYWLVPDLAIKLLYGSLYLKAAGLLVWFGLFIALYTVCNLMVSYFLSLGLTRVIILPVIAAIAQILGIWIYHDQLFTVIKISIAVAAILLMSLIGYLKFHNKTRVDVSD